MDFARLVAHLSMLNPGAPTGCTDNTLGGSDVQSRSPKPTNMGRHLYYRLYQQSGKEVPFVCFYCNGWANHCKIHSGPLMN